ncbi:transglutaminase family protein [Sphingomonas quercus]|uniref:Transglutaminase family protein n=1 Tax=Sphingomonas quercus TaxID=2842451 RepID=A0ABS6BM29_9SPHN|nr:transglutaminase family protein [Sphingomonas quercus]MBU3078441.1 transglutaminase family protein [Sphingomonas quercus]
MRLIIQHATIYSFAEPQSRLVQLLRVTPSSYAGQNVVDWQIDVDCDARLKAGRDGHGNETTMLYVNGPIRRIRVAVAGEVLTDDKAGMVGGSPEPLPPILYTRPSPYAAPDRAIAEFAAAALADAGDPLGAMHALMAGIHRRIAFDQAPPANRVRTAAEAFAADKGSYLDHAHVMIAAARSLGLPTRFVSGYLFRSNDDGPRRAGHGWAEVHVPDYGWIGFDAVNDHCPDANYVRVATGLDHGEAAPLLGARTGGGSEYLEVSVSVTAPEVTA